MLMKVKEAVMSLRNKKATIGDISQTLAKLRLTKINCLEHHHEEKEYWRAE
uniref:Uncharacterized protein n=1 Tax=Anguilla anguilla TaxID=7936 RepID=A0A0E9U0W4_ANGAN